MAPAAAPFLPAAAIAGLITRSPLRNASLTISFPSFVVMSDRTDVSASSVLNPIRLRRSRSTRLAMDFLTPSSTAFLPATAPIPPPVMAAASDGIASPRDADAQRKNPPALSISVNPCDCLPPMAPASAKFSIAPWLPASSSHLMPSSRPASPATPYREPCMLSMPEPRPALNSSPRVLSSRRISGAFWSTRNSENMS